MNLAILIHITQLWIAAHSGCSYMVRRVGQPWPLCFNVRKTTFNSILESLTLRDKMTLVINRHGNEKTINVSLSKNPRFYIETFESIGADISDQMMEMRNAWLGKK